MEHNDIIELLDVLYGMVTEAWGVPLGNDKCIIEREKAIEIINDIKAATILIIIVTFFCFHPKYVARLTDTPSIIEKAESIASVTRHR